MKRENLIHIVLLVLIIILGSALILEISRNGIGWFSRQVAPERREQIAPDVFIVDPYRETEKIQKELDRMFLYEPDIDIKEKDDEYVVNCDLPGMDKQDIEVSVNGNYLIISGARDVEKEESKEGRYFYRERKSGNFKRIVQLPGPVDESNVKAEYNNGILVVRIQKQKPVEETKFKKVHII